MPVTDEEQLLRQGMVAILTSAVPLQTVIGRATDVLWQRSASISAEAPLPLLLYDIVNYDAGTGAATVLLTALAEERLEAPDAAATCRAILRAAVDALTWAAFNALGLEVLPGAESRQSVESDPEVPGSINREGQPLLQQADTLVPLLYLP